MNYKECSNCKLSLINSEDSWKTVCGECFKQQKSAFRQCTTCKQNNVSLINKCNDSYKQITFRECSTCKQKNISCDEPSWKNKCKSCYFKRQKLF